MAFYEETQSKKSLDIKIWAKMLPFFKPYRWLLLSIVLLMLGSAGIDVIFPLFQRYAVDRFIMEGSLSQLGFFIAFYAALVLIQTGIVIVFSRQAMSVEMQVGRDLKRASFVHLQKLSLSFYNVNSVGYLLARVMSDTGRIGSMIAWGLVDILWALAYVVGVFISMFLLNGKLALLIAVVVPLIAILTVFFQNKLLNNNRRIRKMNSRISGAYNEGIVGAKTSKTLVIEEKNLREFQKESKEMYQTMLHGYKLSAIYIPSILFFSSIATALVLARGGYLVMNQALQFGTFSAFISYAVGIFEPIQQLARTFSNVIATQANIERVSGLLEKPEEITDTPEVIEKYGDSFHPKKENWEPIKGDIEFEDVSFKYPDGNEYVLEHFNLKIPAGTNVAIVGETGAGKSTLVNLACRFFEPTSGRVLIDGRDYRERSQLWLHSNIGYVLQNPHLFSGTLRENIRYGNLEATDEDIERVAKSVSADTVVANLENGYDSDVGEGGDRLSTGEKQLVSFARAVLADPRIFVLDEATSSIDTQTEQLIQNAIGNLLKNRTSFLIAHRLSTIRQADLILVVKDGRIVQQGTHMELMKKRGAYFDLYSKQFAEEAAMQVLR